MRQRSLAVAWNALEAGVLDASVDDTFEVDGDIESVLNLPTRVPLCDPKWSSHDYDPPSDWARGVLSRMSFRTGWRVKVIASDLLLTWSAVDSTDSGQRHRVTKVMTRRRIPPQVLYERDEAGLVRFLRGLILHGLEHEMDEFLRLDGELVHDPHA